MTYHFDGIDKVPASTGGEGEGFAIENVEVVKDGVCPVL